MRPLGTVQALTSDRILNRGDRRLLRDGPEFEEFRIAIHNELNPKGTLQQLLVDRVARNAWRLSRADAGGDLREHESTWAHEEGLLSALQALLLIQNRETSGWGTGRVLSKLDDASIQDYAPEREVVDQDQNQAPTAPNGDDFPMTEPVQSRAPGAEWRRRLEFDPATSDGSPVVKGTRVSAGQIVSLVIDGWSWAEILRNHPELTEDDLRACMAYTIETEPDGINLEPVTRPEGPRAGFPGEAFNR
jgi:uncharacterized protein (DUF433 family)